MTLLLAAVLLLLSSCSLHQNEWEKWTRYHEKALGLTPAKVIVKKSIGGGACARLEHHSKQDRVYYRDHPFCRIAFPPERETLRQTRKRKK